MCHGVSPPRQRRPGPLVEGCSHHKRSGPAGGAPAASQRTSGFWSAMEATTSDSPTVHSIEQASNLLGQLALVSARAHTPTIPRVAGHCSGQLAAQPHDGL